MASVVWLAPGASAISEFARQNNGIYLHATCVETAALMCLVAQMPGDRVADSSIGDYLQQMVNDWRAADAGVSSEGASSYVDATAWLRGKGLTVDENVMSGGWWAEMQNGLRSEHCVYLVGVTNAQGLPGDEVGVHNHGLAALGIDSDGNIICGDPDNTAAQEHMPADPVGAFVTYTEQDFVNGAISSLTKVHPTAQEVTVVWTQEADKTGKDAAGHTCGEGDMNYLQANGLTGSDGLMGETFYDANHSALPLADGRIVTATHNADGSWTIAEEGAQAFVAVFAAMQAAEASVVADHGAEQQLQQQNAALTQANAALQQQLAQLSGSLSQKASDALAAVAAFAKALAD